MEPFRPDLLAGKTTLITGGGTGLGRSMALRLAGLGARVAVVGRRPEPLQEVADRVRAAGGRAAATPCDVRDPEAVEAALKPLASQPELHTANQDAIASALRNSGTDPDLAAARKQALDFRLLMEPAPGRVRKAREFFPDRVS